MTDTQTPITCTYNNVLVEYVEATNNWLFELRGRSRYARSLAEAKVAIDKEPRERKKFVPYEVYYIGFGTKFDGEPTRAKLTSFAEDKNYSGEIQAWISRKDYPKRSKEAVSRLALINEHNDTILAKIDTLAKQVKTLEQEMAGHYKQLERPEPPKE